MKTGACYIRVSTEEQTEYSPDSQLKAIREYAKRNDIIIPEEFIYIDDGISGRKAEKRPSFMQMIGTAKLKPKPFDVILLWKFSRFARNREDSIVYKSMLRKQCGIDVISISEQLGEDKTSILIEALIEAMDEYYSINLAEEVRRGMAEKARRGEVVSSPPYGYNVENNVFIIDIETAKIVRMIFNDYLSGMGCYEIARKLNSAGIRTRNNNPWENRTVEYILKNAVYTGKLLWTPNKKKTCDYNNPETIISQGHHKPIIDNETFEKVQKMISENKKKYPRYARHCNVEFMLKGLVRCDKCGATLVLSSVGNGLQCYKYSKGICPESHYISLNKINKSVIDAMKNDTQNQSFIIETDNNKSNSDSDDISAALIKKEEKKLERIREAYEAGVDTLDEYRQNKLKISSRIEELKKNLKPVLTAQEADRLISEKISQNIGILEDDKSSETVKNEIIRSFVSKVIFIKSKGIIEVHYHT
ncbi:MAG TPA: recombinase family protein [Ruminococcus sp.]|nr:recombinase family protein [Ruminococcus sp.]